ncbi:hypothetical protein QIS99_28860 [Streptomyces sp. B-S-A8]|uniref:Centromere-binding protein ParB C-terminal domain-containing protein n=1 Tax=Streptomyces solicavernae TaxID=3043614 RepID=A0ABT6S0I4_9ACTN|nr:hypothetical protein [Streptomyces sp. B-S-A8]MDI3390172.1 hypothetical protein [Streptomyces sp. B-S-A8]
MTTTAVTEKIPTRKQTRTRKAKSHEQPADPALPVEAMKSASFSLPPSLLARMRAAQWRTQLRPDGHHNLSEMVRITLTAEVERLEAKYNRGRPFEKVEKLRTGPSPQGAKRGGQLRSLQARQRRATEAGGDGA